MSRLRANLSGPASDLPDRRRTSDWLRLGAGIVSLLLLWAHEGHETTFETDVLDAFHHLPRAAVPPVHLFYGLGALWAVGLIVVAAALTERRRLARDLLVAGVAAWALSRLLVALVNGMSVIRSLNVLVTARVYASEFPSTRVAIVVAVVSAGRPYLARPIRRLGQVIALCMVASGLYLGVVGLGSVAASVALGWTVAAGVHLLFGSPGGRPTIRQVQAALTDLGLTVEGLHLSPVQPQGSTRMLASDDIGPLQLRVLGRDELDAQLLSQLWRAVLYKDGGPAVRLTRFGAVAGESNALLLAERAGVSVPGVVVAGQAGPGAALIVTRPPSAVTSLAEVDPATVTDDVLGQLWDNVRALHGAHVVHGRLNANHVLVGPDGIALVDFEHASGVTGAASRQATDVAELLASTSRIVGHERAVRAALRSLGADALAATLSLLQPAAMSRELRHSVPDERGRAFAHHLGDLRTHVAEALDTPVPPLQALYRVSGPTVMMAVGTLVGLVALFSQIGNPAKLWATVADADVGWLLVALAVSLLTNLPGAIALMGTVPIDLPLARTIELQASMAFTNLAVPAVGGAAAQVRFLQRQGLSLSEAVAAGGFLGTVGSVLSQLALLALGVTLAPKHYHSAHIDYGQIADVALIAIAVIPIVAGVVVGIPRLRRIVAPPARAALSAIWSVLQSPRRLALILTGNTTYALLKTAVYQACIAAFGATVNFWALLSLSIVIGTIASLVPIPGGGTAVSSVGMSGALAAAGVPVEAAVAAALVNQLVFNYIPALPGWFATQDLLRADYL